MSTIASHRQSLTLSSRRDSTSTNGTIRSASTTRAPAPAPATGGTRRSRAALRDYYGLKAAETDSQTSSPAPLESEVESELDREGFDAAQYVKDLLATESLEAILRTEASLINETRSLDGEKKALVYDNYSKLIAATETIRKMRTNMDPLGPTTSSLTPAISHIAETATALSESLRRQHDTSSVSANRSSEAAVQKRTVQWVLDSPEQIRSLMRSGQKEDAEARWVKVKGLLDAWHGVSGVSAVRDACTDALKVGNT